jgi:hypothetical protein
MWRSITEWKELKHKYHNKLFKDIDDKEISKQLSWTEASTQLPSKVTGQIIF